MQCCEHGEYMSLYLDGLLSAEEALDLQAHLAQCEGCREQWEAMCWLSSLLRAEPAASPMPGFTKRVTARIRQREAHRRRLYSGIGVVLGSVGLWACAELVLLVFFVLLWRPSLPLLLFDVVLPLVKPILSTLMVLGRACGSLGRVLADQPLLPALLAAVILAVALTVLWTRMVFQRWACVMNST